MLIHPDDITHVQTQTATQLQKHTVYDKAEILLITSQHKQMYVVEKNNSKGLVHPHHFVCGRITEKQTSEILNLKLSP